jgi:hypothetical protein
MNIFISIITLIIIIIFFIMELNDTLFIVYEQTGWFKSFFHDKLHKCVPDNWENRMIDDMDVCRYCNKTIIKRQKGWTVYNSNRTS